MTKTSPTIDTPYPIPDSRPPMGIGWMLPLYDPLTKAIGITRVHRALLRHANTGPDQRVLDIGCGTGTLTLLAKHDEPAAHVTGLDPDQAAIARAEAKAAAAGLDVHFDVGFAGSLPYADGSMDRVLSAFMLHHLLGDERERTLTEVRRVLAPTGSLHFVDFGRSASFVDEVRAAGFPTGRATQGRVLGFAPVTIIDAQV